MSTAFITGANKNGGVDWIWTSDNGVADHFLNRTWIQLRNMALSARFELAVQINGRQVSNLLVSTTHPTQHMVAEEGFEPSTFGLWARLATKLLPPRNIQKNGGLSWNWTSATRIFSPLFYLLSYETMCMNKSGGQSRIRTCSVSYVTDLRPACFTNLHIYPKILAQTIGIEPILMVLETTVLPLNYICI